MSDSRHCNKGGSNTRADLLRVVQQLMSENEATRVTFNRVTLEGSNVGAVMHARQSDPAQLPDPCSINICISSNIQGVNNSILVGSEVKMVEPGLGLSFGDVKWDRETPVSSEMSLNTNLSNFPSTFWSRAMLVCAFVLALSLLYTLFGLVKL